MNDVGRSTMSETGKTSRPAIVIAKVGIVGAGQMGQGIAHVCAVAGFDVVMSDISEEQMKKGVATIDKNMTRQVSKGTMTEADKVAALGRISTQQSLSALADRDLIIEAATEHEETKKKIFREICQTVKQDAILCSNTSSISITRLAAITDRPERFMGVHFMNPVPVMKLVELIRGIATEESTFASLKVFAEKLGKQTVSSEDFPAFIVNRILVPMINEAVYTLYEGVGTVRAIDTALKLGANHPMGPLELADFIGLDTCNAIMNVLHDGLADTKYRPCPLLAKYVEAGWLGRKSGKGFYDYSGPEPVPTR